MRKTCNRMRGSPTVLLPLAGLVLRRGGGYDPRLRHMQWYIRYFSIIFITNMINIIRVFRHLSSIIFRAIAFYRKCLCDILPVCLGSRRPAWTACASLSCLHLDAGKGGRTVQGTAPFVPRTPAARRCETAGTGVPHTVPMSFGRHTWAERP
jgi:hypothetical protein